MVVAAEAALYIMPGNGLQKKKMKMSKYSV
jgi:hypothetical protein